MNRIRNERGFASMVIVGVIVLVAAVAGAGWYVYNNRKDDGPALTSEQKAANEASTAACKAEVDDDDFCKFAGSWDGLGAYTMVMTSNSTGGSFVSTFKSDGNGNVSSESDFGGQKASSITIGNTTYIRDETDGAWVKYVGDSTYKVEDQSDNISFDFNEDSAVTASTTSYKRIGTEDCGELTCIRYQIVDTTTPGTETFILFDNKDFKMRRWVVTTAEGSTDTVISYEGVTITEPSPVKEAPSYTVPDFNL